MNYFYAEYWQNMNGMSNNDVMKALGKDPNTSRQYGDWKQNRSDISDADVEALAKALDISSAWLRYVPIVFEKDDLDGYINIYAQHEGSPIIKRAYQSNQYEIVSMPLRKMLEEYATSKIGKSGADLAEMLRTVPKFDPDYAPSQTRPITSYAELSFHSIPNFTRSFVKEENGFKPGQAETITARLVMSKTIPAVKFGKDFYEKFAKVYGKTLDQVYCDFFISSLESVFNLFVAVDMFLSPWRIQDDKDGNSLLTLIDPKFMPHDPAQAVREELDFRV